MYIEKIIKSKVFLYVHCQIKRFVFYCAGKSGHVGRRFASSLRSIGLASHFIHAADFVHGDLGMGTVKKRKVFKICGWYAGVVKGGRDVVMFLSHSGDTEECVTGAYHLGAKGVCTIVMTGSKGV